MVYCAGFSQTIIKGKVRDAAGAPVPFADVYFGSTTIGVVSDTDGEFKFEMKMRGSFHLIVSFVGYEKVQIPVVIAKDSVFSFDIRLKQETVALSDLIIHGDTTPTRGRDLREFVRILLGTTKNASDCSIKNPEDIIVRKYNSGRKMIAHAKAPIIVENRALGYELHYDLDYFIVDANGTNFNGSTFFKELIPSDDKEQKRWEQNREKSYLGSRAHMVRSILADRLVPEGWEVKIEYPGFRPSDKYIAEQLKKYRALGLKDSVDYYRQMRLMPHYKHMTSKPLQGHEIMDVNNRQLMTFKGVLVIVFKNEEDPRYIGRKGPSGFSQSSELTFETKPHTFYENGSYLPQNDVVLGGYFAFGERAAEWVPYGYTPGVVNSPHGWRSSRR